MSCTALRWYGGVLRDQADEWTSAPNTFANVLCAEAAQDTRAEVLAEAMICKVCGSDISDLITDRFEHTAETRDMWYPHELDMLSAEEVPTYGGMKDPTGDVESYVVRVRCSPPVLNRLVRCLDPFGGGSATAPSRLNTWFPPYKWSTLFCRSCNFDGDPSRTPPQPPFKANNIGWLFTPPPGSELKAFLGLKVMELRERHAE